MSRTEGADFEEFYRLEFGRVARAIAEQAGSRAEDFAQEAFLAAYAKWDRRWRARSARGLGP